MSDPNPRLEDLDRPASPEETADHAPTARPSECLLPLPLPPTPPPPPLLSSASERLREGRDERETVRESQSKRRAIRRALATPRFAAAARFGRGRCCFRRC